MARALQFAHAGLARAPKPLNAALAATGLALGWAGDVAPGTEISFSVFYVAPIALAAWYAGTAWGVATSFASAVMWYLADGRAYSAEWIPVWNATVRLGFFVIVTLLTRNVTLLLKTLRTLAETDPRTGLASTRRFLQAVEAETARAARYGGTTSLVYMDLDGFKGVNDRWGHEVGDDVLEAVGRVLVERLRATDLPARLGGDEFAVLLPHTDREAAVSVVGTLRGHLEAAMRAGAWPVGFSVGIASSSAGTRGASELIKLADRLMYEVKGSGKDATLARDADGAGAGAIAAPGA